MAYSKVVDADGHILEPRDLWQNYLEAKYQARGVRFRFNDRGEEFIEVDGKTFFGSGDGRQPSGRLGVLGGIGGYPDMDRAKQAARHPFNYMDGAPPGSMDPHERSEVLDKEGIDVALLYPTIGIIWEEAVADPGLAAALCRAYNNWLVDFCKPYPERLFPVAHIPVHDVGDAVVEMKRTAKLGVRGFFLRPDITDNRTLGHADLDPIWATAQEMGIPVAPHVVARRFNHPLRDWSASLASHMNAEETSGVSALVFNLSMLMLPVQACFTAVMTCGVFERFPRLKYVILETGAGWVAHWLERMNGKYKVGKSFSPLKEQPEYYFRRQCFVSVEPDERTTPFMVKLLGEDKFVWASDFPHSDAEYGAVEELKKNIEGLSDTAQRKILGENAAMIYNLPM